MVSYKGGAKARMSKELLRRIHTSMFMDPIFVAADEEYLVSICHSSSVVELLGIKLLYSLSA